MIISCLTFCVFYLKQQQQQQQQQTNIFHQTKQSVGKFRSKYVVKNNREYDKQLKEDSAYIRATN